MPSAILSVTTWSVGSAAERSASPRPRIDGARLVELVVFDERFPDRHAARLEKRVRHRAADEQAVHLGQQVLDDFDLVRHFRAAEDRDERPLRRFERVPEVAQLAFHQQARRRSLDVMRDPFDRRMRPMRGAERIVHVLVGQRRERGGERGVVFLFLGMEAQILQEDDATCRRRASALRRANRLRSRWPLRRRSRSRTRPAGSTDPRADPRSAAATSAGSACPSVGRNGWRGRRSRRCSARA